MPHRLSQQAIDASHERYHPCRTGIHVCGADHDANEFFTEANFPHASAADAKLAFDVAKQECHLAAGEPQDFVVDLMNAGDIIADFSISRQMLARVAAICGARADA